MEYDEEKEEGIAKGEEKKDIREGKGRKTRRQSRGGKEGIAGGREREKQTLGG